MVLQLDALPEHTCRIRTVVPSGKRHDRQTLSFVGFFYVPWLSLVSCRLHGAPQQSCELRCMEKELGRKEHLSVPGRVRVGSTREGPQELALEGGAHRAGASY